ncbi:MAG: pyridoxal phosphate-dependent aminotransferase [Christensenellaceae bacterium]|nr:pyridoxal phosphate-dependent aminotransferase [Christensenellaceae bacterium]MEA5065305.1 pyridoxal phosphate-dependent aminotransferase [Eubacteriales bacterium]MEA5069045.1 pyridoxal phosphate-dependent aminotransferase [Christensenellaceae bacterium]
MTLSERCLRIAPSATLVIDAKAKAMIAAGEDVISFGAGEPDFDTPEYIRDAAKDALNRGVTRYTASAGTLTLRKEICEKLMRDNGLTYDPADIVVSNGAKQSLFNALSALVNPGDEVLLPAPCWVSYPEMVHMAGGTGVPVPGEEKDGFVVTAAQLRPYVTERTKALILNSPNNPNGCVWPRALLSGIAELAVEKGFYVISDEIYEKLIYGGQEHVSIASLGEAIKRQSIVVNGVSKAFAMTGWRIGYAAAPRAVAKAMDAFQSHSTSAPNSMAQYAAAVALTNGEQQIEDMRQEFDIRRHLMYNAVSRISGLSTHMPEGAFYMMLNISKLLGKRLNGREITGADDFAELLLAEEKVAVVPGTAFGARDHVRVSYATAQETIRLGLERIARFVKRLE